MSDKALLSPGHQRDGVGAALLLGAVNGALTALAGIPSFIVTVATMGIFRGVAYIVTDGMPVMISDPGFLAMGNGEWLLIPVPIWILVLLLVVNHAVLGSTTFGRKIYLTGGNRGAALYSSINVTALRIKLFMITALVAGISGLILASRLYSGQPNAALSYELDAIAAAVLGGTSLTGGYGTVIGTMIGALIIGVINNGMNLKRSLFLPNGGEGRGESWWRSMSTSEIKRNAVNRGGLQQKEGNRVMNSIYTIGEVLVEMMAANIGQGFTHPVVWHGPYPSSAPAALSAVSAMTVSAG